MASSLQRGALYLARANRSILGRSPGWFSSSDALVDVKPGEVGLVSGIPEQHLRRRVGESIDGLDIHWRSIYIDGDAGLSFDSAEAAKAFAEKHGQEAAYTSSEPKSYADNFKWKGPAKNKDA